MSYFKQVIHLKTLVHVAFAVLLTGCAGGVDMLPTLSKDTKITNEQGVVVVRVINASAYPLPFNFLTITPDNLNASDKIKPLRLEKLNISTTNSSLFSSPVKAGNYSIASIRSFYVRGEYWYDRWAAADATFGTFSIKPGEVTDLGTLIYYPKPQEDKYLNTLTRIPSPSSGVVLKDFFPFHAFDAAKVIDWNDDGRQDERNELYVSIAQNPVAFNNHYKAPDDALYFIGKLGVIVKRAPNGEWQLDAVDTNTDLTIIKQNAMGELVVAGKEGKLFFKGNNGQWQDHSFARDTDVVDVHFNNDNQLEVILRQETLVTVMRSDKNALTQWQTMASFSPTKGWSDAEGNIQEISVKEEKDNGKQLKQKTFAKRVINVNRSTIDNKNLIAIETLPYNQQYAFGDGSVERFLFDPITWKVSHWHDDLTRQIQSGAATIGIEEASFWSFTGKPTLYRINNTDKSRHKINSSIKTCFKGFEYTGSICIKDKEKVKAHSESFNFVSIPWFKNELTAVAIASFSDYNFWSGQHSSELKILHTTDGGEVWTTTDFTLPKDYCTTIIPELSDALLLSCNGASGDFYQSNDLGKTWKQVRHQENF